MGPKMHGKWNQIAWQMTLSLNGANNQCHVIFNQGRRIYLAII